MVMPARGRHLVLRGLLVVVLLIGTVMGILWAVQRQLIYFPEAAQVPPAGEVVPGARDVTLRTDDGLELGAWFVPARRVAARTHRWRCWWRPGTGEAAWGGPASPRSSATADSRSC